MTALVLAAAAALMAFISLTATGALAVRLRLVAPRPDRPAAGTELLPASIPTRGRAVADVLGPLVSVAVSSGGRPAVMTDAYLVTDGCVLVVSTGCAACRYLLRESRDLLLAGSVRTLVIAPTTERGIEFVERDCLGSGIPYQVDRAGERARAIGISEFPSVLIIADGVLSAAYIAASAAHLNQILAVQSERGPN